MMDAVPKPDQEPRAGRLEVDFSSREAIISHAQNTRLHMLTFQQMFRVVSSLQGVPIRTEKWWVLHGGANQIVPTDHDTVTLVRPRTGADIAEIDPDIAKLHVRQAIVPGPIEHGGPTIQDVPSNDTFVEVIKNSGERNFYLINYSGVWKYHKADDIQRLPDGDVVGDLFTVDPAVDQSDFSQEEFDNMYMALLRFNNDMELNNSAEL